MVKNTLVGASLQFSRFWIDVHHGFGELARLNAAPSSFALAFILSTSPGFLGSIAGKYLLARIEAKYCFMIAECIGALGLIVPWYGLVHSSVTILQLAGVASSVSAGITIPAINHYTKAKLAPEDIGAGAVIDTLVFACRFIWHRCRRISLWHRPEQYLFVGKSSQLHHSHYIYIFTAKAGELCRTECLCTGVA